MLRNQVALITGAARGMGREIALTYAREGAAVGLLDIEAEELDRVVLDIHKEGGTALGQATDVRDAAQVQAAVQAILRHLGPVDILVNSAGLRCGGRVHEIAEEDWDLCFDVNVKGTFLLCKAVVPTMDSHFRGQPTGNPNWMKPSDVAAAALYIATQRDRVAVAELAFSMASERW